MKVLAILLVLSCLTPKQAFAFHHASDTDNKRIQEFIDAAEEIKNEIIPLREEYDAPTRHTNLNYLGRDIADLTKKLDLARARAARLALVAYGITPVDASGKPDMPKGVIVANDASKGRKAYWLVTARDRKERWAIGAKEENMLLPPQSPKTAALTGSDGVTTLFESAFKSPAHLALYLYHEREHFRLFITPGKGDKLSWNAREKEAWIETEKIIDKLGVNKAAAVELRKEVREELAKFERAVTKENSRKRWTLGLWSPKEPIAPHSEAELEMIKGHAQELEAIFAEEFESVRKSGRSQENLDDIHKQAQELREQVELERDERKLIAMQGFAQRLCDSPDGLTQKELDGIGDLSILAAPYRKKIDQLTANGVHKGFGTCQEQQYLKMLRTMASGRLQLVELRQWAGEYRRERHFEQLDAMALEYCTFHLTTPGEVDRLARLAKEEYAQELGTLEAPPYGEACNQRLYYLMIETLAQGQSLSDHFIQSNGNMFWEQEGLRLIFATGASYGLADLAQRACSQGGGITSADFAPFRWYPNRNVKLDRLPAGLSMSGCARELYLDLFFFNSFYAPRRYLINPQWVNVRARQLAQKYTPAHSPPAPQDESPAPQPAHEVRPDPAPSKQPRGGYDYRPAERARDKIKNFRFPR